MKKRAKKWTGWGRLGYDYSDEDVNPAWEATERYAEAKGPRCRVEYDKAADLLRAYHHGDVACKLSVAKLEQAVQLAFGGACKRSAKLYRRLAHKCKASDIR